MQFLQEYILAPLGRGNGRAKRIARFVTPWIAKGQQVLDFGCGNLLVGKYVGEMAEADVTGIDVIDINITSLPFTVYDGEEIPFENDTFDVTYAAFILHHTNNVKKLLAECTRVTRKRLLILEDVYRNGFELLVTKSLDHVNKLVAPKMPLSLNFKKEKEWLALFEELGFSCVGIKKVRPAPLRPTRHRLFVLDLV